MRAAFVDRDGTINVRPPEHDYVRRLEDFVWLPSAVSGLVSLAEQGFKIVVVSNQRGIARGLVAEDVLGGIEDRIQEALGASGFAVLSFRYCRHEIRDHCNCRKPAPGLLLDASSDYNIDLRTSWMVGDSESDVAAGAAAGCHTARIATRSESSSADVVVPSLMAAATAIGECRYGRAASNCGR